MEKLFVDLVPQSAWFSNLRSELKKEEWDIIRKDAYKKANYRCVCCGGRGEKWWVEAHERWSFDNKTLIQKLERIIALCPACHETTHFGLANVHGRSEEAKRNLMRVRNISEQEADIEIAEAFRIWEKRSEKEWVLDLSFLLSEYGNILSGDTKKKIFDLKNGAYRKITAEQERIKNGF